MNGQTLWQAMAKHR